ncbi:LysR substrate-binding domain-containing protein [Mesorhizobium sp.]|uniref:LysR substrate-binding domain-containing protein n=1 Tax=Mesorhizobium sp. TaxID=1871066 RepID=UPI00345A0506
MSENISRNWLASVIHVKYQADSFRVLKEIVAAGLGHTILPLSAFYREQEEGLYKITRLVQPRISRHLVMALPSSSCGKTALSDHHIVPILSHPCHDSCGAIMATLDV